MIRDRLRQMFLVPWHTVIRSHAVTLRGPGAERRIVCECGKTLGAIELKLK